MTRTTYRHVDLARQAQLAGHAFGCPAAVEGAPLRSAPMRLFGALLWAGSGVVLVALYLVM